MNHTAKLLFFVLLLTIFSVFAVNASAADSVMLNYRVTTYFPSESTKFNTKNITDDNIYTSSTLLPGCALELVCSESRGGIGYVYVKFAENPVEYTIEYQKNGQTYRHEAGKNGFLHDLTEISIDSEYESIMIFSNQTMQIADIILYSKGKLPSDVQRWEKTLDKCDILFFPTHADDDALFMGALIAENVDKGRFVQAAFICNHNDTVDRPHELLDGLWTMGVKSYPIIGQFRDIYSKTLKYASTVYDSNEMRGYIVECIRRTKPSVVVGHDLNGEYGHGAHMLSAKLLCEALDVCGDSSVYPDSAAAYGVHTPVKTFLHLYHDNQIVLDVDSPLGSFGGLTSFDIAAAGYECHKSQHKYGFAVGFTPTSDCRKFGLFRSKIGYDVSVPDIMYGIEPLIPDVAVSEETKTSAVMQKPEKLSVIEHGTDTENSGIFGIIFSGKRESTPSSPASSIIVCAVLAVILLIYGILTRRRH